MYFDSRIAKSFALAVPSLLCAALLSGCALGDISLSGPVATPVTGSISIKGTVHGGENPISGATLTLIAMGNTGYGQGAASIMTSYVTSATVTAGGTAYANGATVTITGGGGSGATATATIGTVAQGYPVTAINITNSGSGYTSLPTITISPAAATVPVGAGATATPVLSSSYTTSSSGNFALSGDYTCPSSTSLVYLLVTGGNSGAGTNSAIALAAPLGQCGPLLSAGNTTTLIVNELTTVGMAFAMSQYFTTTFGSSSTDGFGAPNTTQAQIGMTNAMKTFANLVNVSNGSAVINNTLTTSGVGTITVTPESTKLITIGNILADCVNSSSSSSTPCTKLFGAVAPTGSTPPTDTLQAAVYLNLNPTSNNANTSTTNLATLNGLSSGFQAFGPGGGPYTDWTLGITYGSNTTVAGTGTYLLYEPEHVAIDAGGNVWLANFDTTSAGNSLTELSPTGTPILQALTTIYGTNREIAIDPSGNIWVPDSYGLVGSAVTSAAGKTVYEFVPPVAPATTGTINTFYTGNDPAAIAFDGLGNAFVIEPSFANTVTAGTSSTAGTASTGTLEEIPASSATGTYATTIATNLYTDFSSLVVDKNYTIWITGGGSVNPGTAAGGVNGVYQFLKNSTTTTTGYPAAPTATAVGVATTGDTTNTTLTSPEGAVAVDNAGDIIVDNYGSTANSTVGGIAATSTTTLANAPNTFTTSGVTKQQFIALDGAGNIWTSQAASGGYVYAYTSSGAAISPSVGFNHTYSTPYQVAIDPSGNVWVGNSGASASASKQAYVTEIVGAAVPVVTPIAAGLPTTAGGNSTLATRP